MSHSIKNMQQQSNRNYLGKERLVKLVETFFVP